jgi:DNA repair photolyase
MKNTPNSRQPDYSLGRFFISPILGCKARCSYCYIFSEGYNSRISLNQFTIDQSINWILGKEEYKPGVTGSILSIGAWGDPFPPHSVEAVEHTLEWVERLCKLENPIQLISRFSLTNSIADKIASFVKYKNQLLFSTSISTFRQWREIEPNTDSPIQRLETLKLFREKEIPVNLMIKPFLNGITDKESEDFISHIKNFDLKYCVVGSFHWDEKIYEFMNKTKRGINQEMIEIMENEKRLQLFDCTSEQKLYTYPSHLLDSFIEKLKVTGVNVFKKSSCVNSHILQVENISLFYENDPNNFCVKCGVCELTNHKERNVTQRVSL